MRQCQQMIQSKKRLSGGLVHAPQNTHGQLHVPCLVKGVTMRGSWMVLCNKPVTPDPSSWFSHRLEKSPLNKQGSCSHLAWWKVYITPGAPTLGSILHPGYVTICLPPSCSHRNLIITLPDKIFHIALHIEGNSWVFLCHTITWHSCLNRTTCT